MAVAGWPEELISYNHRKENAITGLVAGWPEELISYNTSDVNLYKIYK